MKAKLLICTLLLQLSTGCLAQEWTLVKTITLKNEITAQSVDTDGKIYIGTTAGDMLRYDQDGNETEVYSAIGNFPVTLISAWNRFKVFLYYKSPQQFIFLDRFSTTPITYSLSDYQRNLVTLCAPGIDNSVWVLSADYNELRKYNIQNSNVLLSNPLQINLSNASYMQAYQNLVLISDSQQGIHLFDQYGNLQMSHTEKGVSYFQVVNEQLVFLAGEWITSIDVFRPGSITKTKAPREGFSNVLKWGDRYYFISKNQVLIYQLSL